MLIMILKMLTKEMAVYEFRPEDCDDIGVIQYDLTSGKIELLQEPKQYPSMYKGHALNAVRKFVREKSFPKTKMVAWY